MPILKKIILALLIGLGFLDMSASVLEQADSAYQNGNYEEAAALYSQVVESQGVSAGILYNFGNSYYHLGKEGEAMLCYERAKKIDPSNAQINQNINFLATKVMDANKSSLDGKNVNVEPDSENFIDGIYRLIAIEHTSNGWAIFAVMAFILFLICLALYMFTPNVLARKTGFFGGLTFLGFTVVFLIFSYIGAYQYNREDEAILTDFTTQLLERPEPGSKPTTTPLHKGTKLKILEIKPGTDGTEWLKVKLNSENIGWVKKDGIEII